MQIDLRVLELLASKVCHDLVSPVSAINNGVELIEDIGDSVMEDAMKLIGDSAVNASRRLRLFRMAYGRAGSEENLGIKDVRLVAEQYVAGGKITLNWPDSVPDEMFAGHRGGLKTLINLLILSEEILAYGGQVTIHDYKSEERTGCRVEVAGRNAQLSPLFQAALDGTTPVEELSPRSIQSYITGRFATHFGLQIEAKAPGPDQLDLVLSAAREYKENPAV